MPVSRRDRDEQGVVAVVVALMSTLLLLFAALAVDLGNLVARSTWTQAQADQAALAGGSELLANPIAGGTPSPAVTNAVVHFLNANAPQQDDDPCWRNTPVDCVAAADLTDSVEENGEVRYTDLGVQVIAPRAWVDFGLSGVIGFDGADVSATATAQIKSGGRRVMPMFAVDACGWGRQTLIDPANNPTPVQPALYDSTQTNSTTLLSSSVTLRDGSSTEIGEVVPGSTGNTITFTGKKWDRTKRVGFFHSDGSTPVEEPAFWLDGDPTQTDVSDPAGQYTEASTTTVGADIPDAVAAKEGVWWVRVWNATGTGGAWSAVDESLPFRVGGAVLECSSASNEGNFGTLRVPRTDQVSAEQIPANIALGWQPPITPAVHTSPSPTGECTHGLGGAVVSWGSDLRSGTNCVGTDPGISTRVLNAGLVKGGSGYAGLLTTSPTRTGCARDGSNSDRTVNIQGSVSINDEVLSCYLTDTTTSLADIASPTYSGGPILDKSIYDSPRFFYVPVLSVDPGRGAQPQNQGHSIIEFRPAFLTDETATSTSTGANPSTATPDNGLTVASNGIVQLRVVLFNADALPTEADSVMDYIGAGPRILRMVD